MKMIVCDWFYSESAAREKMVQLQDINKKSKYEIVKTDRDKNYPYEILRIEGNKKWLSGCPQKLKQQQYAAIISKAKEK